MSAKDASDVPSVAQQLREKSARRCVHFGGFANDNGICRAGVGYTTVMVPLHATSANEPRVQYPCWKAGYRMGGGTNCPHQRFPTEDELDAEERRTEEHRERMSKARAAIQDAIGGRRSVSGRITPCPACGVGTLTYSVASNGHTAAQCTTRPCVAWIE